MQSNSFRQRYADLRKPSLKFAWVMVATAIVVVILATVICAILWPAETLITVAIVLGVAFAVGLVSAIGILWYEAI